MDIYRKYERNITNISQGKPKLVGVNNALRLWIKSRKQPLNEIFQIEHGDKLRNDLAQFLQHQFDQGNIRAIHAGPSTTDYKPTDWVEETANDLFNRLVQYFETIRSQTERDMYSPVPLAYD